MTGIDPSTESDETQRRSASEVSSADSGQSSGWGITSSGAWPSEGPPPTVGSVLKERFVLEAVIGRGGMGTVYRAKDLRKEEAQDRFPYVAVKLLNEDFRKHPKSLQQLQREVRKAQQLAHPNITAMYDFDRDGEQVFAVMELLEGTPLDRLIKQSNRGLSVDRAFHIVKQMAAALEHAHASGVIHLDFKPANVFVLESGRVKVLDFGIARRIDSGPENEDKTLFDAGALQALTPSYASCEMMEGAEPDPRDDVYALACVTYELLSGSHPYGRESSRFARRARLQPARLKSLSQRQWQTLTRGLAFERSDRVARAREFAEAFDAADRVSSKRSTWLIGSGALGLGLTAVALSLWVAQDEPIRIEVGKSQVAVPNQRPALPKSAIDPAPSPSDATSMPLAEADAKKIERTLSDVTADIPDRVEMRASAKVDREIDRSSKLRNLLAEEGLAWIPAGRFSMGSPTGEGGRFDDEGPLHTVTVAAFALAKREVTRGEFADFIQATGYAPSADCWVWGGQRPAQRAGASWKNPGFPQSDADPVVCVNWRDARAFAQWKSRQGTLTYRLPTESEWEYAARAGTTTARYWDDNPNFACRYANVLDNTARRTVPGTATWNAHLCDDRVAYTAPVGSFEANRLGIHDMLGNVWEWTEDCYHESYEGAPARGDAWAVGDCSQRVARGGSWIFGPRSVRAAVRVRGEIGTRNNITGFRLAASLP